MVFNFESQSIASWQRVLIVQQILQASPNLSDLTVAWSDFVHCSQTYVRLKRVHLLLNRKCSEAKEHVNIDRLIELVPNLRQLETSCGYIILNDGLIEFILNIIHRLSRLMILELNKRSASRCKRPQKLAFQLSLKQAIDKHLPGYNNTRIQFSVSDWLCIWL